MICDFVIAIFFCRIVSLCVFGLVVAKAGEVGVPPRAHSRLFGYLPVGQLVASFFTELAARVPRKMLVFEGIVINFAKEKEKKPHPQPLPHREKKQPHPQPLSEWRGE